MANRLIVAVDQGTSSSKGLLLDTQFAELASVHAPVALQTPAAGWVQQDATEIWQSVLRCLNELGDAVPTDAEVAGIALSNQRESAIAWNAKTGEPIGPMLGWQDRRTQSAAAAFDQRDAERIRAVSGLPLDPMFSALKFAWLLDNTDGARAAAESGDVLLGTVDSYLRFKLAGEHVIEIGNASRTQLLDVATGEWSIELLELFNIPMAALPRVVNSAYLGQPVNSQEITQALRGKPIVAVLADSHAALFGQSLNLEPGATCVKATLGTGSSIMAVAEQSALQRATSNGLVSTIAWQSPLAPLVNALEGNILSSGSTVVWLAESFGRSANELAEMAEALHTNRASSASAGTSPQQHVVESEFVNLVPSFGGLGAPWWQSARGAMIDGMSLATGLPELALAAFEAIALQIGDLLDAVDAANESFAGQVFVDGGPASNDWLLQLLADLSQRLVVRSANASLSAVGAAAFGAREHGIWASSAVGATTRFAPKLPAELAANRIASWHAAVHRALSER
ncbi:MAG: hypothetical protein RL672_1272 [Actinomycetota bacterium]|jgi:glycerol kinase